MPYGGPGEPRYGPDGRRIPEGHRRAARRKSKPKPVKVSVPYAPTPKGKAAERQDRRERKATTRAKRAERKAVRKARSLLLPPPNPQREYQRAKYAGIDPPASLAKTHPRAYKEARRAFTAYHREHEGLKEDPIAELVISSAATAGLGAGAGALVKGAKTAAGLATTAKAVKAGQKAAKAAKAAPAKKIARVRSAPKRAARRVKETPKRVKTAPRRAKRAATTKEGRRAAARGGARKVYAHPVGSAAGISYVANQAGVDVPGVEQLGAAVEGHAEALRDSPVKTLKTTARAIPAIVTGPAALLGAAGSSVANQSTEPLEREASKQFEGLKEVGGKLLSGDPETVQKAVEDEVGLSFVAPLPAVSRVRHTKAYKGRRGKVRGKVAARREKTRAKRRQELREFKTGARSKKPRKIRHAVRDTATGEERILRRTGKLVEGRRQRKEISQTTARAKASGERAGLLASKEVIKHVRRSKLSKGDHNVGDALATVAQYGISRKRDRAMEQLDDLEASIGRLDPDEIPAGTINDLANVRWLKEHPEAFADKHFWRAVDAYKRQAREIEHSPRKKVLAISDVYGHARPEERLEAGVNIGGRTIRTGFYKDPATLERKQAQLSELRGDAKLAAQGAAKARNADDRARYGRVAAEIAAQAKVLERELKDYRAGFKQAQKDFVREAQATIRNKGLEQPAYVKDVKPRQGLGAEPSFPGGRSARKQHMAKADQARRGIVMQRDFETLVNQSIAEPRMRRAMHENTTAFVEQWATPVGGKRYLTSKEIERAINRGELDESQFAVLHSQFFKQAILDPYKKGDEFTSELRGALDTPMLAEIKGRADDVGHKYAVIPKEALREFVHQMEPPKGMDKLFGGANRFLSRVILGYSPAWAVAQLVAEGIPASIAIGANPARWARVVKFLAKEDRRLSRKDRAALDGTVGESAGVTPHPQIQFKPDTNLQASRFFRLSSRNPIGRALLSTAKGDALGKFDRWKGGKYRKAVAAAKADKELNSFVGSLGELMRGQRSIAEALKGKPLKAQMEYIAKHPKQAAKLERYLDDVMGNWRALTRHEAKLAPLIVFYPFVRYSLRWTFWSFPKQHPVKAQILYFLAQQNSEELEKLIGGPPANPLDYTFPVYESGKGGQAVLPGGSRIAPGMNAITTSIGKGQLESLATALNPAAGIAISTVTGVDPLSGEKKAHDPLDAALLGLNQLLSMPAPSRLANLNRIGQGEQSGVSKAFEEMDPMRDERSALFPFAPQSGPRYRDSAKLGRALEESGFDPELGDPAVDKALEAFRRTGSKKVALRVKRRAERSDSASDEISALVEEYVGKEGRLRKLTDAEYELLGWMTGKRVFPYEPPKPEPFGLPDMDPEDLREQFGLPATSASALREQFGIK